MSAFLLDYDDAIQIIHEYEVGLSAHKKTKGSHYTPPKIAKNVVKKSLDQLFDISNVEKYGYKGTIRARICDPACGGGIFLIEAVVYLVGRMVGNFDIRIGKRVETPWGYGHIIDTGPSGIDVCVRITEPLEDDYAKDSFEEECVWMKGWDAKCIRKPFSETYDRVLRTVEKDTIQKIALSCIYGFDIDPGAVETTKRALGALVGLPSSAFDDNILLGDFLFDERVTHYDAFIGNPPFIGGGKISGIFGSKYLKELKRIYDPAKGPVDYCVYFFRRASYLLKDDGVIGLIATNTISQGATRRGGLKQLLLEDGMVIFDAEKNWTWPGSSKVTVSTVYLTKNRFYKMFLGQDC